MRYLGLGVPNFDQSTQRYDQPNLAFLDEDLALDAGTVEFFAGKGRPNLFSKVPMSGKIKPFTSGGYGECWSINSLKSGDSVKTIDSWMEQATGYHKVSPPIPPKH